MRSIELSTLIGDVYDAALDPARWPNVLDKARTFVGGSAAVLWTRDSVRLTASGHYDCGISPRYRTLYFEEYSKYDPLHEVYLCLDVGDVISQSSAQPYDEMLETRFYKEWAQPQGFVDNVLTLLEKSATSMSAISVMRHERDGLADEAARQRMRLIAPHVRRAVLIGKVIEIKTEEAATLTDTLDGISAGMFLVDARGRIVHANASGRAMLNEGSLLHVAGAKLAANYGEADAALHDAFMAASSGDAALGVKGIAVPLSEPDGERYVAHILPLSSGARRLAGLTYQAAAAMFVHKAALDTPSLPEVIAKTYKFTPMELRVLLAIVEVGGVPQVAEALGIAETTVKTHLGRLYEKTGARRQADLVKLVAGFSNPLVA